MPCDLKLYEPQPNNRHPCYEPKRHEHCAASRVGGFSVDGSVAGVRNSLNKAYYGKEVTPTDILIKGTVKNPHAAPLLEAVTVLGK